MLLDRINHKGGSRGGLAIGSTGSFPGVSVNNGPAVAVFFFSLQPRERDTHRPTELSCGPQTH